MRNFAYNQAMKLLFVVHQPVRFNVETPEREPLGGTESATAYLARQLAANGHDVSLMTNLPDGTPERLLDVRHLPIATGRNTEFLAAENFDAVIGVSVAILAQRLREAAPRALHIAWLHALPDQPAMKPLPEAAPFIDHAVFVSEFHRNAVRFAGSSHIIGNGIAPAFENLFAAPAELLAAKQNRGAYTTTPFRGLHILIKAFAQARIVSELDVWSGMEVYQADNAPFMGLFAEARATPRLMLHAPIGQPELAERLKPVAFLFYPSVFFETYCISALEAIAAGLKVVSTDLGALRETTLGFAELMPVIGLPPETLLKNFTALMEKTESQFLADRRAWAEERFAQSRDVVRRCNWRARAKEWEAFLGPRVAARRGS